MKKHLAVLGSTGSIGTQVLDVVKNNSDLFEVEVLAAQNSYHELIKQAIEFRPNTVIIGNEQHFKAVSEALEKFDIKVFAGEKSISQIAEMDSIDMVLIALVGFAGLAPTIAALKAGKPIAIANKEAFVVAGEIVTQLAREKNVNIYPIDSEHSAIFQCLAGEFHNTVEKIYLTGSGGPFRGKTYEELAQVNIREALNHPNWCMGKKITIDSASLMNKGLEVIEAKWLFGLDAHQIEVIIHPQSIIHSLVQFEDGSIKAQMGLPDMKLPIQYALTYPNRLKTDFPRFNFVDYPELTFEKPDMKNFRNLALAYEALEKGGNMPCILNAANEVVVEAFLTSKIEFVEMPDIIEKCMQTMNYIKKPSFEDYVLTDNETRIKATEIINR